MRVKDTVALCIVVLLSSLRPSVAGADVLLVEAVKRGDFEAVRAMVQKRANVSAPEADGSTALHWAVRRGDLRIAELLIRAGADVKGSNRYGVAPLMVASSNGDGAMVEILLKAGADPNTALPGGETALMAIARTGNVEALKVLRAHGADVNAKESWRGQTALMWAAGENHPDAIQALVEFGADVNARSNGGFTPLLFAVRAGNNDAVRVLTAAGANVNDNVQAIEGHQSVVRGGQVAPAGASALVMAIVNAHYDLAVSLLDQGADPNADAQGWTALHQLMWTRRPNVNGNGLPRPIPKGNVSSLDLAKALLAHGANPNARQGKEPNDGERNAMKRIGATPFLLAAKAADVEMMRFLVANGADPLLTTNGNLTPLMAAAGVGTAVPGENPGTNEESFEAVKLAYELGGDVNAVDANGETAMHGAAIRGANPVVEFLVEKGSKLDVKNSQGWNPLTIADGVFYVATVKRQPQTAALLRRLLKERGLLTPEQAVANGGFVYPAKPEVGQ